MSETVMSEKSKTTCSKCERLIEYNAYRCWICEKIFCFQCYRNHDEIFTKPETWRAKA